MIMMKAIVKKNESDTIFSIENVRVPKIHKDELLVRIHAIGVGIHDGYLFPLNMNFPYPIGIEGAGVIEEVGSDTIEFETGERIAFVSSMQPKGGTWAEYAVVSKDALIAKIPAEMSFTSAAAIPVAGNTVLKAFEQLTLQKDDYLFIAGASGAIGTLAIQLAKLRGLHVASSASLKNHDYMRSTLGADLTVDYNDPSWHEQVNEWGSGGVDGAIAIQPGTGKTSMEVVKNGGIVVPVSDYQLNGERDITINPLSHHADVQQALITMIKQIVNKEIQLTIEEIYSFDKALDALRKTTTRHARGKVIITIP